MTGKRGAENDGRGRVSGIPTRLVAYDSGKYY